MKKARKLTALMLLAAFVFAFIVPVTAMAATDGSITLDNPKAGQTYTAYKIFDVTYTTDKSSYSYTIAGDSEWFDVVATKNDDGTVTSKVNGLTFTKAASGDVYVVTKADGFSAAAFADTLKANTTDKTGVDLEDATVDGKAVKQKTGLPLGYYFVSSTSGALCNLTTTDNAVTIHDKNDIPFDKVDDKESVEVGEVVKYTLTGKVPDTTGFTSYTYKISDTMSAGLTFNKDVVVKIGEQDVTSACNVTNNATGFELAVPVEDHQDKVGTVITVTYTATVNENAVAKIEKNHATLEYSNNPKDSTETKTITDEETVYSAKIHIIKYTEVVGEDGTKSEVNLDGAKFVLMNEAKDKYYKFVPAVAATENTEAVPADVDWVSDIADATVFETKNGGVADIIGLKDGKYFLKETEAPDGYNLMDTLTEITINGANATDADLTSLTKEEKVLNQAGTVLPETGGIGTTIFYVVGAALVLGAGVLLVTKKRMTGQR